jgi:SAM-dependent methyltransferase
MFAIARKCGTTAPLVAGEAYRLPFADAQFDCVSDITVVQHIPLSLQAAALGEMIRVLTPGGRLILMELIRGNGLHIFPHTPKEWIDQTTALGATLVGWFGQEYLLVDRLFVRVAHINSRSDGGIEVPVSPDDRTPSRQHSTVARRIYWALRHVTVPISTWTEPIAERIFPRDVATHGVFVFQK